MRQAECASALRSTACPLLEEECEHDWHRTLQRLGERTSYIQIVAEDKASKDAAEHGFKANEIIDTVAVEQCVEDALGGEGEAADA